MMMMILLRSAIIDRHTYNPTYVSDDPGLKTHKSSINNNNSNNESKYNDNKRENHGSVIEKNINNTNRNKNNINNNKGITVILCEVVIFNALMKSRGPIPVLPQNGVV
jgi:hypothetical protein